MSHHMAYAITYLSNVLCHHVYVSIDNRPHLTHGCTMYTVQSTMYNVQCTL